MAGMRDLKKTNPKKGGTAAAAGSAFSIVSNVAATRTRRSHKKREKSQKAVLPNCARASRDARDARARPREVRIELTGRIVVPPISSSRPFGANGPGTAEGASNSTDNPPPRGTTRSPMAQLTRSDSSMSNLAEEFPTRIMECGLLPLTCAGVEVSNKLHVTCTVVKGAPPASPARAVTTHETAATQSRGVAHRFPFPRSSPVPVPPVPVERSQNRGSHSAITGHQQFLSAEQVQHHRGGGVHDSARQHGFGHFPRAAGGRPEDTKAAAVRRGDSRRHLEVQPHP